MSEQDWEDRLYERAAAHFHQEMVEGCHTLKRLYDYWPGYFYRDVCNDGGVVTVKRLLATDTASQGFAKMWELQRLDISVEAFVLLPWYEVLFDQRERRVARSRLAAYEFDVDGFLRGLGPSPQWSLEPLG